MRAVAIKKSSREKTIGFQEMGTLRCDGCVEGFFIGHNPKSVDKWVAERQANWLEKVWRTSTSAIRSTPTESNYPTTSCLEQNETLNGLVLAFIGSGAQDLRIMGIRKHIPNVGIRNAKS
jgi:hypothetical protein